MRADGFDMYIERDQILQEYDSIYHLVLNNDVLETIFFIAQALDAKMVMGIPCH